MSLFNFMIPALDDFSCKDENSVNKAKTAPLLAFMTAIVVLNNIIAFTPGSMLIYYAFLVGMLGLCFLSAGKIKINIDMILIYLTCLISYAFNDIPAYFKAEYRFIAFVLISLLIAPAICSRFLAIFRTRLLYWMLKGCVAISLASMVGRLIGLSYTQGQLWCGITNHSMILGPVAGIAFLTVLCDIITAPKNSNSVNMWGLRITLLCTLLCLVGAASRTAIIATFFGSLVILSANFKIETFIKLFLGALVILLLSSTTLKSLWQNVENKNQQTSTLSISSREAHWNQRIVEFKSNPLFGIGIGTIDTSAMEGATKNETTGQIETGSSWLSILSMTGILGMTAFLFLIMNTWNKCRQIKNKKASVLLLALLILCFAEMCAEGYIFAAGNFLFFFTWLIFGAIDACHTIEQQVVTNTVSSK